MKHITTEEYKTMSIKNNDQPLTLGGQSNQALQSKLKDLPLIHAIEIVLHGDSKTSLGIHVAIVGNGGILASFPWYDHMERRLASEESAAMMDMNKSQLADEHPFADADQGWNFVTTADEKYQYILQGSDDGINEGTFLSYFKVDRQRYLDEWEEAIKYCKQLQSKN